SSKGGTTEAAMQSFEQQQVKNNIITGANAALHRAIELGKGN
ncbi:MAG: pyrroline-5-carboxylate reductase, partial [Saprospiraceae bacterium]|nr:pyrroline-5-carboxylate reductase [Saprospiraceae bacterium]